MVSALPVEAYRDLVRQALAEDRGRGDATSAATVAKGIRARGTIMAKSDLVVAGIDVAAAAFRQLDPKAVFEVRWGDGSRVQAGEIVADVIGDAHALLEAERTALNFLQLLSGIATLTAPVAGTVTELDVTAGQTVALDELVAVVTPAADAPEQQEN